MCRGSEAGSYSRLIDYIYIYMCVCVCVHVYIYINSWYRSTCDQEGRNGTNNHAGAGDSKLRFLALSHSGFPTIFKLTSSVCSTNPFTFDVPRSQNVREGKQLLSVPLALCRYLFF